MKNLVLFILSLLTMNAAAQESAPAIEKTSESIIVNASLGIGTFAAGENLGGSVFWGTSLSADWIPDRKTCLSYGLETGLLGGETQGNIIYGIPAIFRLGWQPDITKNENIDIFILLKTGWSFGIWGTNLENDAKPNGIVGGFNFGGRYFLTPLMDVYAELGYTYYGLARSKNHPEYPLGYGSGKLYTSLGLSLKIGKH
ncbi:MAG: hypothetical protein ACOYN5_02645 [Bacteroidales bacterium]